MAHRLAGILLALTALAGASAHGENAPSSSEAVMRYADPAGVVIAVQTQFAAAGGAVRVSVYQNEDEFLEAAIRKAQAVVDENGLALISLTGLEPGEYAFAAYYDANGDGQLNRGKVLGKPKEPVAFSNGVHPSLRKPRFEEAKVEVAPGAVVVIVLED